MKKLLLTLLLPVILITNVSANLSPVCKNYFSKYEVFLSKISTNQLTEIKQEYKTVKNNLISMPIEVQDQICNEASEELEQIKTTMGIK